MAPRIGDWAVLEVESIDWLPVQGKTKKPLYQMEGMRHMKITYSLSPEELEYMLGGLSDYTQTNLCFETVHSAQIIRTWKSR